MSHHFAGGFPRGDARLDFAVLYAFPKPRDSSKSILIMDGHPSVGVNPLGPTTTEPFAPEALYEIKIDTNGDAIGDITYQVRFASSGRGTQNCDAAPPRTRWSMRVGIHQRRQSGWQEHCCRTSSGTTQRARRHFRTMAERSPTMSPINFWPFSRMAK